MMFSEVNLSQNYVHKFTLNELGLLIMYINLQIYLRVMIFSEVISI